MPKTPFWPQCPFFGGLGIFAKKKSSPLIVCLSVCLFLRGFLISLTSKALEVKPPPFILFENVVFVLERNSS